MPTISRRLARASLMALALATLPAAATINQTPVPAPAAPSPALPEVIAADALAARQAAERAEADAREAAAFDAEAAALRPGQYAWRPERAAAGPVEIVVSLADQKAYVYRAGTLIAATTVSTGRTGHRTPTGSFRIMEKKRSHFSNRYNNAPMPNMQRLTMDGIALHAGQLPGYAASHGCVRLPMEFSRLLFGITRVGQRVHIVAHGLGPAAQALAAATRPGAART